MNWFAELNRQSERCVSLDSTRSNCKKKVDNACNDEGKVTNHRCNISTGADGVIPLRCHLSVGLRLAWQRGCDITNQIPERDHWRRVCGDAASLKSTLHKVKAYCVWSLCLIWLHFMGTYRIKRFVFEVSKQCKSKHSRAKHINARPGIKVCGLGLLAGFN